jgi:cyclomaltodextrinase
MEGQHDPDCRRTFPWDEGHWDHDLLAWFRRAIALRKAHPVLRHGRYQHLHADDTTGVYAFARQGEGNTLAVVLNNGATSYDLDVPVQGFYAEGTILHDLWGQSQAQVVTGKITGATLPPRAGAVFAVNTTT